MKFPELDKLPVIWISFLTLIAIMGLFTPFSPDFEILSFLAVFIHVLIVLLVLGTMPLRSIFIWAFLARVIFMVWDLYAYHLFRLPNSGADTELYYGSAIEIYNDFSRIHTPMRAGVYGKLMGILFYIVGPQRMLAQYINVLIGLFIVVIIYKILNLLEVTPKILKAIVLIAAFFPNSIVMSAILLREIFPTFFVALSLYYFILWYKNRAMLDIVLSMIMLGVASTFHSGVIGIIIGYAYFYMFYKKETNHFQFTSQSIIAFVVIGGIVLMAITQFGNEIFSKFKGAEELEDIYSQANRRDGNSAYLTGMQINSPVHFVVYGPIKAFYFLTSPLPMNWRGGIDIFSFTFDSTLYLITLWFIWKNWKNFKEQKPLIIGLLIAFIGVAFIFGIGVANAGTAIRHRQKIIPLVLIILAVILNEKQQSIYNSLKYF